MGSGIHKTTVNIRRETILETTKCYARAEGGLTTLDLHDSLLIFVAFTGGINAIATGALIDMHTMRYKKGNKAHP